MIIDDLDILFIFQYLSNLILYTVLNKTLCKIVNKYTKAWSPIDIVTTVLFVVNTGDWRESHHTALSLLLLPRLGPGQSPLLAVQRVTETFL